MSDKNTNRDSENKEINIEKRNKILNSFIRTFQEFLNDIKNSYPEYKNSIENDYQLELDNIDFNMVIIDHFMTNINPYLLKISEKDDSIFTNSDEQISILKNINFCDIWCQSNKVNKEIIWKYLHTLILLGNNYNNVIKKEGVFKQFNEILSQSQMDEESLNLVNDQAKAMLNMVKSLSGKDTIKEESENNESELPGGGMFENTKIGEIAKELASELNFDEFSKNLGDLGEEESKDPSKLFDNLIGQDPMKLMGLIQNVGTKIQNKISSGEINEKELVSEAQTMMKGLQDNPLFQGSNGEGLDKVFGNGIASNLFGGGNNDEEELDDLDKDINKDNEDNSSFNPDNIRKMGFNSIFSKLGGGNNKNNPMGNIGDMMSQMMSDPSMQQMVSQMAQDPSMQQMAQQMNQGGDPMQNMNTMMSQMMGNQNIQQMAQQMANNPSMQQMAQQMENNPSMQQMAQQMAQQNGGNKKVRVDKNKLRNMSTRERLKKKLENRKKEQEKNLYKND